MKIHKEFKKNKQDHTYIKGFFSDTHTCNTIKISFSISVSEAIRLTTNMQF